MDGAKCERMEKRKRTRLSKHETHIYIYMYMETVGSHIGGRAVANAEKRIGGWGGRYGPGAATAASEASPFFLRAFLFLSLSLPRLFTQSLVRSHFLFPLSASHFLQRVPPPSHLVIPSTTQFSTHAPRFQPPPTPPGTAYLTPPPEPPPPPLPSSNSSSAFSPPPSRVVTAATATAATACLFADPA